MGCMCKAEWLRALAREIARELLDELGGGLIDADQDGLVAGSTAVVLKRLLAGPTPKPKRKRRRKKASA